VQDPVEVDSTHYKVKLENERVSVPRVHYGAHEKSVMQQCSFTFLDGKTEEHRSRAGETMFSPREATRQRTWAIKVLTPFWWS